MSQPTIEDVIDLCKEHGDYRATGPDSDFLLWLRAKLARADEADDLEAEAEAECDGCYERDHQLSQLECERNALKRELAAAKGEPTKPAPSFAGMESVRR